MDILKQIFLRLKYLFTPSNTDEFVIHQKGELFRANVLVYLAQQGVAFNTGGNSNIRTDAEATVILTPGIDGEPGTISVTFDSNYPSSNFTVIPIEGNDVNYVKSSLTTSVSGFTAQYLGEGTDFGFVTVLNA